ncbi:MAG: type II toxin-antitoxin system VapC family toxin [Elusimicrobia bacterium]|nr:type II toxin-antitoxin system VapC family toxin [Elusimicrobiota bacterium]
MILVDTSVWSGHLRETEPGLVTLLNEGSVVIHPFIIEELACGNLPHRKETLDLLHALPVAQMVEHAEVLDFIATERLHGTGVGSVDVHLMASARLSGAKVWSKDKALCREAKRLHLFGGERPA